MHNNVNTCSNSPITYALQRSTVLSKMRWRWPKRRRGFHRISKAWSVFAGWSDDFTSTCWNKYWLPWQQIRRRRRFAECIQWIQGNYFRLASKKFKYGLNHLKRRLAHQIYWSGQRQQTLNGIASWAKYERSFSGRVHFVWSELLLVKVTQSLLINEYWGTKVYFARVACVFEMYIWKMPCIIDISNKLVAF